MELGFWVVLPLMLAKTTPLLFAALGGLISERAGVINIGLEGMMLAGAFSAAVGGIASGSAWIGLMSGATGGFLLGGVHAFGCIRLRGPDCKWHGSESACSGGNRLSPLPYIRCSRKQSKCTETPHLGHAVPYRQWLPKTAYHRASCLFISVHNMDLALPDTIGTSYPRYWRGA